jgi:chromosome segregation ATPase
VNEGATSVIEMFMYVALGGLAASFVFAAILPAINRRAHRLAKKRMIALFPLSIDELTAEKDGIRAQYALKQFKLEQRIDALNLMQAQHHEAMGQRAIYLTQLEDQLTAQKGITHELQQRVLQLSSEVTLHTSSLEPIHAQVMAKGAEIYARDMVISQREQELAQVQNTITTKNSVIAGYEAQLVTANQHLDELQSQLKQRDNALVKANSRILGLEQNVSNETQFSKALKEKVQELETSKKQLTKTISEKTDLIHKITKELQGKTQEYEATFLDLTTTRDQRDTALQRLSEIEGSLKNLTHDHNTLLDDYGHVSALYETLQIEFSEQDNTLQNAKATVEDLTQNLNERNNTLVQIQDQLATLTDEHKALLDAHTQLEELHTRITNEREEFEKQAQLHSKTIHTLTQNLSKTEARLKKKTEALVLLQKEHRDLQSHHERLNKTHTELLKAHQTLEQTAARDQLALSEAISERDKALYKSAEATGKAKELSRLMDLRTSALESAKNSIASLETMLADERLNVANLKEKVSTTSKSHKDQVRHSKALEQQLQDIQANIEVTSGDITRHTATIAEKEQELATLKVNYSSAEKKLATLKSTLKEQESTASQVIDDLKEEVKSLKTSLEKVRKEKTTYVSELNAMKAEQEQQKAMREAATREFSKRMATAFTPDAENLDLEPHPSQAPNAQMKHKIAELKSEISGLESSLKKTRADREFLKTELVSLRSETEQARQAVEADNAELRQRIEDIAEIILTLVEEDENAFEVITLPVYSTSSS